MNKLKKYKFSKLYSMGSGISSKPEQAGHGSPFLSFSTVFNNYFIPEELNDLMNTSETEQDIYSILKGDIFLTRTSEVIDELGMSSVALKDYPKSTYSGFLKRLRPTQTDITYHKYMAFYLRSKFFRKTMTNNAVLTLRASLNENIFSYLDLILPEFEEQVKIGDFLYNITCKIELNNRINSELENLAKTIYDYWFVQFDFPDENGKPYKSSGGKMVYNQELKREIPASWEVENISQYYDFLEGPGITKEKYTNLGHKFINIKCIENSDLDVSNASMIKNEYVEKYQHFLLNENDVVLSTSGTLGRSAIVRSEHLPLLLNTSIIRFRPRNNLYFSFMYLYLNSEYFLRTLTKMATGSIQKNFGPTHLEQIREPFPTSDVLLKFSQLTLPTIKKTLINQKQNQQLTQLRDWLLPMLMTGQITVK